MCEAPEPATCSNRTQRVCPGTCKLISNHGSKGAQDSPHGAAQAETMSW
eukprot:CAMPEP_0198590792 /NCGR_PEP_ID=MMETSP1462-20131121/136074_1 /TAXON_ID=1333877 /ORGANISM="Brandtodinium nutriculum, Strain RCC3387" /LENGTH=48 /DNA_ID= /DNA_START= /DNA_END= /DNA_ORIENTATION=